MKKSAPGTYKKNATPEQLPKIVALEVGIEALIIEVTNFIQLTAPKRTRTSRLGSGIIKQLRRPITHYDPQTWITEMSSLYWDLHHLLERDKVLHAMKME